MSDVDKTTQNNAKKEGGITGKGFKPGVSGNPAGRPKDSFSIADILRNIGKEDIPNDMRKKLEVLFDIKDIKDMKMMEGLLRVVFMYALQGKSWAVQFIAERTEGKSLQQINIQQKPDEIIIE